MKVILDSMRLAVLIPHSRVQSPGIRGAVSSKEDLYMYIKILLQNYVYI